MALVPAILAAGEALAFVEDATARIVRETMLIENFWTNLLLISIPLLALGLIAALLYRIGVDPLPRHDRTKEPKK